MTAPAPDLARRAAGRPRGAYIELNFTHGELLPLFWWLAREADVELDFYVLRANLAQGAFAHVPGHVHVVPLDPVDPHQPCREPLGVEHLWGPDRYDFLILGTAEPADRVAKLAPIPVRKLLVVHNFEALPPPAADTTLCVLTEPGRARAAGRPIVAIAPFYTGEITPGDKPRRKIFCVPGAVQQGRRNYGSLVRALAAIRADGITPDDLVVRIVGRWSPRLLTPDWRVPLDGELVRAHLVRERLDGYVEFPAEDYDFPRLYERIRTSRYVLPLIDDVYPPTRRYLVGKASGSLNQGIGWLAIPVLNRHLAETLGLDAGYRYALDDVAAGMREALGAPDDDDQLGRVARFRATRLEASARAFAAWARA